jgi:FMN phosphatase YigB (HAD superfamily)
LSIHNKQTILFDLDGTLLPVDFNKLLDQYFKALTKDFVDLATPNKFIDVLMKATENMINNDGEETNQKVFMDSFFSLMEIEEAEKQEIMQRFDRFYEEKFPLLSEGLCIDRTSVRIIDLFKKSGHKLAVATNPLFPRIAILERMEWAGLDPDDFVLITSYENMHYCKPHVEYYQEILDKLDVSSDECAMIGNNMQEDMVAGELGIESFLIEDFLIDEEGKKKFEPDWRGSLNEFVLYIEDRLKNIS